MIIDNNLRYSNAQAITTSAASTNVNDYVATADIGTGRTLFVNVNVVQAFATLTSLDISFQTATDAAFTSPVTLWKENFLLAALNTANTQLKVPPVPPGCLEFTRLYYTVNGSNATAGTITADLVKDQQQWYLGNLKAAAY